MKRTALILLAMGALVVSVTSSNADAHDRFIGIRFGGGYGYGGGGWGTYGSYYGNGGHDYQPHWHTTQTPYGTTQWYGNGPHDYVPHQHSRTPWSYQGYSNTGAGPTTSYYSQQPYYYAPW